jgi:hypothetical protein
LPRNEQASFRITPWDGFVAWMLHGTARREIQLLTARH